MLELLQWVELENAKKVLAAHNVSNFLLTLYAMSYILNRKGCFLAAFIFCEIFQGVGIFDSLSDTQFYIVYLLVYCCLYCYAFLNKFNNKTLLACVIMILFDLGMAIDAKLYPESTTLIYEYYTPINLSIHLFIISSLFRWTRIKRGMGDMFRAFSVFFRINDSFSFLWYNLKNKH